MMNTRKVVGSLALTMFTAALFSSQARAAQNAALRIVVVEGEDAVNVIEQKTAVAPVVEVRDRNDQPVAGAVVRFAISRGRATFSGARALTVTTNAAGRAVATGLTPTGGGALQISAAASFQGQTAAVTIAQTNVMTATAAGAGVGGGGAGAGGSSGAGGGTGGASASGGAAGGGTGGGLSATTVGIVGGAVAGGAIAAKEVLGSSGLLYKGSYSGIADDVFSGPSVGCNPRTSVHSGTVELDIAIADDGTVKGEANISGTISTGQAKPGCEIPGSPQSHGGDGPVQGTKSGMTAHDSHPGNPGVTADYDIAAAFNGNDIVGTFTFTLTSANIITKGVFPFTLRQQ